MPAPERLVAIGDLHGDLQKARRALRLAGVVDEKDRWVGGKTVVVQVSVPDVSPSRPPALWSLPQALLYGSSFVHPTGCASATLNRRMTWSDAKLRPLKMD